jgi:hypothetical protein
MDDQCVVGSNIPRPLMREFLEKCHLRLATHTELRDAYEETFGLPFACLPAVVPARLVRPSPAPAPPAGARGALMGSVWSQRWLDRLLATIRKAGVAIDWYGNHRAVWLKLDDDELRAGGLHPHGVVAEPALVEQLTRHPFVLVPTGTLQDEPEFDAIATLSLPGRILFAVAAASTPVIVVGSPRTAAAAFVERHGLGVTVPYDADALRAAVAQVTHPETQDRIRRAAASLGPSLSDRGVGEWLAASVAARRPVDDRFERLFPRARSEAA